MTSEFLHQQLSGKISFAHFVITRFNLKNKLWKTDKQNNIVLSEEWMKKRLDFFTRYCLPSVKNQTNKDFKWLIYFDSSTHDIFREYIDKIIDKSGLEVVPLFVNGYEEFSATYCEDISKIVNDPDKYIITTRLDNDDIVHKDFIKRIQESFREQNFMAVNFTKILKLHPEKREKIYIDYKFSNHFVSLIEKPVRSRIVGCYSRGDTSWNVSDKIIQISDRPYCIETISENNLLNDFCGFPVLTKTDLSDFMLGNEPCRSTVFDLYLFQPWKMSWRKLGIYYINKLKQVSLLRFLIL